MHILLHAVSEMLLEVLLNIHPFGNILPLLINVLFETSDTFSTSVHLPTAFNAHSSANSLLKTI